MTALGVGLVGAGTVGTLHAEALRAVPGARLVAVAEPREEAGRALAAGHGAAWLPSVEALLEREDVELVVLATPSGLHADGAVHAARAGKHVLAEKPIATTLADADLMIGACHEAGVRLAVIFQSRFSRDAVRLRRAVEAGLLGRIVLGNALVHWSRPPAYYVGAGGWRGTYALDGGGALINQAIHTVDLLLWMLGPVESVAAHTATLRHEIEAEDVASASLRFRSGALGAVQATTALGEGLPARLDLAGTEGSAVLEDGGLTLLRTAGGTEKGGGKDAIGAAEKAPEESGEGDEPYTFDPARDDAAPRHAAQLRAVVDALAEGREPPVPGREARRTLELVLAVYESARTGRRVTLPFGAETG